MALQITNVKLSDRTRNRLEAESNQQRIQKPHDIRGAIPLVDYTNPAKFPPYVFREYPKMPLLDDNRPIVIDESGGVLVFYDAADEVEFKDMNPTIAEEIERNAPAKSIADRIAAQEDEITSLRAKLSAAGIATDGPKKKPSNRLAAIAREPAALVAETAPEASGGLRGSLPSNPVVAKPKVNPLKNNKN